MSLGLAPAAGAAGPYLTGGIGIESREALAARRSEYNFEITAAAAGTGHYLASVGLTIESERGVRVLEATMDGPLLLARLEPGTYTVHATFRGETLTQTVTIPAQGRRQAYFYWSDPDEPGAGRRAVSADR